MRDFGAFDYIDLWTETSIRLQQKMANWEKASWKQFEQSKMTFPTESEMEGR